MFANSSHLYNNPLEQLHGLPVPKYTVLTEKPIGDMLPVQAGRGCNHTCSLSTYATERMEPLEMACIAGVTPPDVEVMFFDDRIETIPYDRQTDLVAVSVQTYGAGRAYEIASHFKKRNIPGVMGGYHPSLIPHEIALHADSVVIGEAEGVWPELIEDARNKKLKKFYASSFAFPLIFSSTFFPI